MDKKAVILRIYGRVQGVGFRYYTQKEAASLNIKGWVRNRPDGSVYVEAEGDSEKLHLFMDWCEVGPDWARVSTVEKQFVTVKGFQNFEVK